MSTELLPEQLFTPDAEEVHDMEMQRFSMAYRKPDYPVTLMMPFVEAIRGPVVASMCYYAKHLDIGFEIVGNTEIDKARNELANRFLKSNAEWSFWLDSDVFIPYGNEDTFNAYSGSVKNRSWAQCNTLTRLLSHNQAMVGGVYAGRFKRSPLTIQPDLAPRSPNDLRVAQALRDGQRAGGLQPVEWLAAGLMLVHRKVFELIMENQPITPNFPGEYYPFFTRFADVPGGEDIAFSHRAKLAGVHPMLDTDVRAGHIGPAMFLVEESQPVRLRGSGR